MEGERNPDLGFASIEAWCAAYIRSEELAFKVAPPAPPAAFLEACESERIAEPGRPPELVVVERAPKTPRPGALVRPDARARLLHTFWHHELQATELFAWAILAFPETPEEFRRGLLGILQEELGHMQLFADEVERLGFPVGSFPVRDWFWQRVPSVTSPLSFLALVGLGLESVNLDHAASFAELFEAAGDPSAARVERRVGRDEERHVDFARRWFGIFTGSELDFTSWCCALPAPLSPLLFRGKRLDRAARSRAGIDASFLDALEAWQPEAPDSLVAEVPRGEGAEREARSEE
jgi:uncharacterized ferritin-like protein (DUF455 family)